MGTFLLGLLLAVLTLHTPFALVKSTQALDWNKSGSGKNSGVVKKKSKKVYASGAAACIVCFALIFTNGIKNAVGTISVIAMVVNLLCIVAAIGLSQLVNYKDAKDKKGYQADAREEAAADLEHKTAMAKSKAQLNANKAMANSGTKVVKAKVGTAVATEKAKEVAVKSATVHMAVGAVAKPKEAIEYAQASGALAEGKELADKMADNLMGDMAPTVIDGQYKDVTEEAKSVMSDDDAQLVERIKGMTRETMCDLLQKGADALMLDTDEQSPEEIADNVLRYAPAEYVNSLPNELSDFEKAVAVVESSAVAAG